MVNAANSLRRRTEGPLVVAAARADGSFGSEEELPGQRPMTKFVERALSDRGPLPATVGAAGAIRHLAEGPAVQDLAVGLTRIERLVARLARRRWLALCRRRNERGQAG